MALEGSLEDMSLSDLFQVFRMGPKTGVLLLYNRHERGVIYVNQGLLVDAFVVSGPERKVVATKDEAVLHMLDWTSACFIFRHDPSVVGRAVQIKHDAEWLVLENMRRQTSPQAAVPYRKVTLDTRLQLSPIPSKTESQVSLGVDQWRILSHAANHQTLREICAETKMPEDKAMRIVAELLAIGLIDVSSTIAPPTKATDTATSRPDPSRPAARQSAPPVGRSLLSAILRRVSEL